MLDINNLEEKIAESNIEKCPGTFLDLSKEILSELIAADAVFYSKRVDNGPLIKNTEPAKCYFFYTDENQVNKAFEGTDLENSENFSISSFELVSLAKKGILSGICGFYLNNDPTNNTSGIFITLADYLDIFNRKVLGTSEVNQEVMDAITFIYMVCNNDINHLSFADSNQQVYISSDERGVPLDLQSLWFFSGNLRIDTKYMKKLLSGSAIKNALRALQISQPEEQFIPCREYKNELDKIANREVQIQNLSDAIEDTITSEIEAETQAKEQPEVKPGNIPVKDRIRFLFQKKNDGPTLETESADCSKDKNQKRVIKTIIILFVAGLILVGIIAIIDSSKTNKKFTEALNSENYKLAQEIYEKNKVNSYENSVKDALNKVLVKYGAGEYTYEEATEIANQLYKYDSTYKDQTEAVLSNIKYSKECYQDALKESDIAEKIELLAEVVEEDTENYQNALALGEASYDEYIADLENKAYNGDETALQTLLSLEPDNESGRQIQEEIKEVQSFEPPIIVTNLEYKNNNLYISWENLSAKTIKSVYFYVQFYDKNGSLLSNGSYTAYKGIFEDSDGFEEGYVTSEKSGFANVWSNQPVETEKIVKIAIIYEDGTSITIDDARINKMMK